MLANLVHVWEKFLKSVKGSSGHLESSFDNPAERFSTKGRNFFAQSPKKIKIYIFFENIIFPQNVALDT